MEHEIILLYHNKCINMVSKEKTNLSTKDKIQNNKKIHEIHLHGDHIELESSVSISDFKAYIYIGNFFTNRTPSGESEKPGLGTAGFAYMLNDSLSFIIQNNITEFSITGELKELDMKYWPGSLIAYEKFAQRFGLSLYFTDRKPKDVRKGYYKEKYTNHEEFYQKGIKENEGILNFNGDISTVSTCIASFYYEIDLLLQKQENEIAEIKAQNFNTVKKNSSESNEVLSNESILRTWFSSLFKR